MQSQQIVLGSLMALGFSLLFVGVVSGTLLRHVVQILPIVVAAVVLKRRPQWGASAAIPLFVFWGLIVVLIWLFLAGLSTVAAGPYTPIEKAATMFMLGFSIMGVGAALPLGKALSLAERTVPFVLFAVMQVSAMWASFLPPFANR